MTRILVVDDAATVRLYVRHLLARPDRAIDEAVNGLEALERALATPYDLYVVDVNMPGLDGFAFLRELRRHDVPQAPALMLSAQDGPGDRRDAWAAGANAYLPKPLHPARFVPVVDALLGAEAA